MSRNLIEYPINKEEVIQTLLKFGLKTSDEDIGCLDQYILGLVTGYLSKHLPADIAWPEDLKVEKTTTER